MQFTIFILLVIELIACHNHGRKDLSVHTKIGATVLVLPIRL